MFGCSTYYHVSKGKLEPWVKRGFFMGYGDGFKWFRVWSPSKRKIILSKDIAFEKLSMLPFKSNEDLGKAEDVIKQVKFESSIIRNASY